MITRVGRWGGPSALMLFAGRYLGRCPRLGWRCAVGAQIQGQRPAPHQRGATPHEHGDGGAPLALKSRANGPPHTSVGQRPTNTPEKNRAPTARPIPAWRNVPRTLGWRCAVGAQIKGQRRAPHQRGATPHEHGDGGAPLALKSRANGPPHTRVGQRPTNAPEKTERQRRDP